MRYQSIRVRKTNYPIWLLCRVLQVSRQGYYSWLKRRESSSGRDYQEIDQAISEIHVENNRCYGTRRQQKELSLRGHNLSRNTVRQRMHKNGLKARYPKPFRHTTKADNDAKFAPNLLARKFDQKQPNKAWVGDITYIKTTSGFIYLATVIDLFSRMILGWSVQSTMTSELVTNALEMAIGRREIQQGLIFHSDRGSQYTSEKFQEVCKEAGIIQSMSRKGNCWDNAVSESFFSTIKKEKLEESRGWTKERSQLEIFTYIETYYNRRRLHSSLGYQSPFEFERKAQESVKVANAA